VVLETEDGDFDLDVELGLYDFGDVYDLGVVEEELLLYREALEEREAEELEDRDGAFSTGALDLDELRVYVLGVDRDVDEREELLGFV